MINSMEISNDIKCQSLIKLSSINYNEFYIIRMYVLKDDSILQISITLPNVILLYVIL